MSESRKTIKIQDFTKNWTQSYNQVPNTSSPQTSCACFMCSVGIWILFVLLSSNASLSFPCFLDELFQKQQGYSFQHMIPQLYGCHSASSLDALWRMPGMHRAYTEINLCWELNTSKQVDQFPNVSQHLPAKSHICHRLHPSHHIECHVNLYYN